LDQLYDPLGIPPGQIDSAILPLSLLISDIKERFSPAGPIANCLKKNVTGSMVFKRSLTHK
jgi:hypothetical protein